MAVIDNAPKWIVGANSFEIDALASATPGLYTRPKIKEAGLAALAKFLEVE
jgi:hypothetical protein